jgi:hypothetical protein
MRVGEGLLTVCQKIPGHPHIVHHRVHKHGQRLSNQSLHVPHTMDHGPAPTRCECNASDEPVCIPNSAACFFTSDKHKCCSGAFPIDIFLLGSCELLRYKGDLQKATLVHLLLCSSCTGQ